MDIILNKIIVISEVLSSGDEPQNKPKVENVGEEFFKWAEIHWLFNTLITKGLSSMDENGGESCQYPIMREIFIQKINELSLNSK